MTLDPGTVPPAAPRSRTTNGLAIAALVCSVLSLLSCCIPNVGPFVSVGLALLGAILGYVAMGQIKRTGEEGYGLALAGAIIGALVTVIMIVLIILMLLGVAAGIWAWNIERGPGMNLPGDEAIRIEDDLGEPGILGEPGEVEPPIDAQPVPDATDITPEAGSTIDENEVVEPEPAFE